MIPLAHRGFGLVGRLSLWILAGITLLPLYFMIASSVRTGPEYAANPGGLPGSFSLANIAGLVSDSVFYRWVFNSVALSAASTALSLIIAVGAAHALTHFRVKGSELLLWAIASLMIIPPILMIVPLFVQFARFRLIDTYTGAIVIYTGLLLPFTTFVLTQFMSQVPMSLREAAEIDGAGPLRTLVRIIIPLIRPILTTLAVVNVFYVWNDLLIGLVFLQSDTHRPLMVGLATLAGRQTQNIPLVMSGVLLSVIPILLLYAVTERGLVRGLTQGSLQGE
jgi:ABC-type glycerol-3-phosphate transport system permease component